ncbi:hypothetical protein NOR_06614 [Metarhizium rileyi]|uniref:Uncharacterized protein n=1 Tax=Metarhizium rileyi (strain RCEF 4871) TaxID=1649241 RepID=A0A167A5Z1_METRR|nr:hypothetical protein NOR_06614 [Metarhizium rileyi RCEF 4871]TWU73544.1 hypothetical protein ED733_003814 [Metarhizium rileyi]
MKFIYASLLCAVVSAVPMAEERRKISGAGVESLQGLSKSLEGLNSVFSGLGGLGKRDEATNKKLAAVVQTVRNALLGGRGLEQDEKTDMDKRQVGDINVAESLVKDVVSGKLASDLHEIGLIGK